jgi:nucleotide-binding universal stress UspA family protein
MILLKSVLVATDFSEPSDAALAYGRALARNFGASLQVLHVATDLMTQTVGAEQYVMGYPDAQRELEAAARQQVDALLTEDDRRELSANGVVFSSSRPAWAISGYAKDANVDLIVMGTHGRSGISHLMMGSVAEYVLRTAPCPVLTVKHPEHEFVLPEPEPTHTTTS